MPIPVPIGNIRDHAPLEQLVVLTNLESLNSVLIRQGLPQPERLATLNGIAITQMRTLLSANNVKTPEMISETATTRRLAVMNLALRGIEATALRDSAVCKSEAVPQSVSKVKDHFGPEHADTFRRDLHPDYVLAHREMWASEANENTEEDCEPVRRLNP